MKKKIEGDRALASGGRAVSNREYALKKSKRNFKRKISVYADFAGTF